MNLHLCERNSILLTLKLAPDFPGPCGMIPNCINLKNAPGAKKQFS